MNKILLIGLMCVLRFTLAKTNFLPMQTAADEFLKENNINASSVIIETLSKEESEGLQAPFFKAKVVKPISILNEKIEIGAELIYGNGKLTLIVLKPDQHLKISGVDCGGGEIVLRGSSSLCRCSLGNDHTVGSDKIPKYSEVYLENGNIKYFKKAEAESFGSGIPKFQGVFRFPVNGELTTAFESEFENQKCIGADFSTDFVCPATSVKVTNYPTVSCCDKAQSSKDVRSPEDCYLSGSQLTFYANSTGAGKGRHVFADYKDNKRDGKFNQWAKDEAYLRVEGQYKTGQAVGAWRIHHDKFGSYTVKYSSDGNLIEFKYPNEGDKEGEVIKVVPTQTVSEIPAAKHLGYHAPDGLNATNYFLENKDFNSIRFYNSSDRKQSIGIAISEYRFFYNHIGSSGFDIESFSRDDEFGYWKVYDKKGGMCKSFLPIKYPIDNRENSYYPVWYDCSDHFLDAVDHYLAHNPGIDQASYVYDRPNGKRKKIVFKQQYEIDMEVLERKVIDGEVWINGKFSESIYGEEDKVEPKETIDSGTGWVPFYREDKINLVMIYHGC